MKSNIYLTVSHEFFDETGFENKDPSVKRYFLLDFEKYARLVNMLERRKGRQQLYSHFTRKSGSARYYLP